MKFCHAFFLKLQKNFFSSGTQFFRYIIGGIGAAAVNYIFFLLFSMTFEIHYIISMASATVITWIYSFFINKFFVFQAKTKRTLQESLLFGIQQIVLFGVASFLMWLAVDLLNIPKWFSWLLVSGIMMVLNFTGMKIFIWRKENEKHIG